MFRLCSVINTAARFPDFWIVQGSGVLRDGQP